jgi:hypothetical protein
MRYVLFGRVRLIRLRAKPLRKIGDPARNGLLLSNGFDSGLTARETAAQPMFKQVAP